MFLLVPAYPGCPGSKAVKRSLLLLLLAGYTQLKLLDVNNVGRLLHKCMPAAWLGAGRPAAGTCSAAGAVEWNPSAFGHPPPGWLQSVWAFLVSHAPRDLSMVDALPLVPARVAERQLANTTETVTELVPLSTDQTTVARRLDGLSLSADVEQVAPTDRPTMVQVWLLPRDAMHPRH